MTAMRARSHVRRKRRKSSARPAPSSPFCTVKYQYTIPTISNGWEIRVDYNFDYGGNASNYERADCPRTRQGSQVASGNIFYTNTQSSCSVGDILVVTVTMQTASSGSYAEASNL